MNSKLVLGTAQLGSAYGVSNEVGELDREGAFGVLDAARRLGVDLLDTAEAYGNSERFIGDYRREHGDVFKICTKLPGMLGGGINRRRHVRRKVQGSANRLLSPRIFIYYLHSFAACKDAALLDALAEEREDSAIEHVGVSVYEPDELRYVIERVEGVDAVQIPFNVFNCHAWMEGGLLKRAQNRGIMLLARSVYLQGMVFKEPGDPLAKRLNLSDAIRRLRDLAMDVGMEPADLACGFVCSQSEIDHVVLGSETKRQVESNVDLVAKSDCMSMYARDEIIAMSELLDQEALDPRRWNLGGSL